MHTTDTTDITTDTYEAECTLLNKTKALLKEDKRSLFDIANASGIPFYWLQRFASSQSVKDPSVNRIQYLYEFLTNSKLPV